MSLPDIDTILTMLQWDQPEAIQARGRACASQVRSLEAFLQPVSCGKSVWENCARVLAERSDADLLPHLPRLLAWLQDLNWPGAPIIQERLLRFERTALFERLLSDVKKCAVATRDDTWLIWLLPLTRRCAVDQYDVLAGLLSIEPLCNACHPWETYLPVAQAVLAAFRANRDPQELAASIREAVAEEFPDVEPPSLPDCMLVAEQLLACPE